MREFREQRKIKKIIYSKVIVLILLVVLVIAANSTWKVYQKERESADKLSEIQKKYNDIKNREKDLANIVSRLKTDQGKEEEIRNKFQVAKDGEEVIILVDKSMASDSSQTIHQNFFSKMWQKVKGVFSR
ncbi:MAG: septum formation initiator family protein [Candidatus Paceibacterota bacterium]